MTEMRSDTPTPMQMPLMRLTVTASAPAEACPLKLYGDLLVSHVHSEHGWQGGCWQNHMSTLAKVLSDNTASHMQAADVDLEDILLRSWAPNVTRRKVRANSFALSASLSL